MNVNETVLNTLTNAPEPLKAGEIAEISGLDKKQVDKALKTLKQEEKIIYPKRCYYAVKS
jgi:DNA-binding IclR family transcriptional regulator